MGENLYFAPYLSSGALVSGLFGNNAAIYVVLAVVGLIIVAAIVVGLIVLVLRNINREWPIR